MLLMCFRLKEPEPASRSPFPPFGSKFRYSGRTQYQSRNAALTAARQAPTIDRNASKRFTGPPSGTIDSKGTVSATSLIVMVLLFNPRGGRLIPPLWMGDQPPHLTR